MCLQFLLKEESVLPQAKQLSCSTEEISSLISSGLLNICHSCELTSWGGKGERGRGEICQAGSLLVNEEQIFLETRTCPKENPYRIKKGNNNVFPHSSPFLKHAQILFFSIFYQKHSNNKEAILEIKDWLKTFSTAGNKRQVNKSNLTISTLKTINSESKQIRNRRSRRKLRQFWFPDCV